MGTPGDKAKIGKVVDLQGTIEAAASSESTTIDLFSEPLPSTSSSGGASSTTMGRHITRLPEFQSLSPVSLAPPGISTKPDVFQQQALDQPSVEEYFSQSKYYEPTSKATTFLQQDHQEPGPSGLQTPKTKSSTSLSKIKKKASFQGKKYHTCGFCHKNFGSLDKLTKHQQIHTGSSPFKCEHCKKTFTSKFKLVRHALIHSDRKPFSCTVCERTFHRKDHLKNHIKIHSPSKKIFTCDKGTCKKEYTSMLSFRKHLAIHAAEEGNLTCQICLVSFGTKEEILYHLKVHAGSRTVKSPNEKKFVCDQCDRKFFTKKDVRRHLVVHTGLREFLCQFCPQRFGRKDHLVRHIKKSHNKKYSEETDESTTIQSVKTELEEIKTELEPTFFDQIADLNFPLFDEELKDLGSSILEDIVEVPEVVVPPPVLSETDIERLMETTQDANVKLPAFSQTFQPPPSS